MSRDPILATRDPWRPAWARVPMTLTVRGGLHYLTGNAAPHFSLTCWYHRKGFENQCEGGGAAHETILALFPRFADLAALHLADINGAPMHALGNGWYWLAGALGGAGEQYHGSNSTSPGQRHTPAESLEVFARHMRIPMAEAHAIRLRFDANGFTGSDGKAELSELVEDARPRWKAEADACIAKHGLTVYGDPWPPAS